MKVLPNIEPNETFKHKGDLLIEGDVGAGSKIELEDGALTINGVVHSGAHINVLTSKEYRKNNTTVINNFNFAMNISNTPNLDCKYSLSMDHNGKQYIAGNVNIKNRIFTQNTVEICGNDVYVIRKMPPVQQHVTYSFGGVIDEADGPATARIDGVEYSGREIRVEGQKVIVDNQIAIPSEAPKMPLKVIIKGSIGDNVHLKSDVPVEAVSIGKSCFIYSEYNGIVAAHIDDNTTINVHGPIQLTTIGSNCTIKSSNNGIEVDGNI
ncbi:MAG: hypothetical protein WC627_09145, partial [Legionella sp.]